MKKYFVSALFLAVAIACDRDPDVYSDNFQSNYELPAPIALEVPDFFPPLPQTNVVLTEEGIELGRKLFYDPILSGDNTQACASCHDPAYGFTDFNRQFSEGIDGKEGARNAMAIFNLAWNTSFFWDGRSPSLEAQALKPVVDPIEMHESWSNAMLELEMHEEYPTLFREVYGGKPIDSLMVADAIAQFEMTIISNNSEFDRVLAQLGTRDVPVPYPFKSEAARRGHLIFNTEPRKQAGEPAGGDCFHCHGGDHVLFQVNGFENNGLDANPDSGLARVTRRASDIGKFKTPSLRNLAFTAPYMHDGRFQTLKEVIDFYNNGVHADSPNLAAIMKEDGVANGLGLTEDEKQDLIAFLMTLTDSTLATDPRYSKP